jgi:hypothetical protein
MTRTYEPDAHLIAGSRVRVHLQPKRFPICYTSDWPSRVAYEDEHVSCATAYQHAEPNGSCKQVLSMQLFLVVTSIASC